MGVLLERYGLRVIYDAASHVEAELASVLKSGFGRVQVHISWWTSKVNCIWLK